MTKKQKKKKTYNSTDRRPKILEPELNPNQKIREASKVKIDLA